MKHTLLIGTDFRRSSLKMREKIYINDEIKPDVIRRIKGIDTIDECVILTTCNRVEIYIICSDPQNTANRLIQVLARFHNIEPETLKGKLYIYQCEDAVRHLFRVSAGTESMVIGESEILGQIKDAYELSRQTNGSGPFLNKLFQTAIALGKEVRRKTPINTGITSIGAAAASLALELGDPSSAKYGIVGCGEMGTIVAKNLSRRGASHIYLTNRSEDTGRRLSMMIGGNFIPFGEVARFISTSDIIITATSSDSYIITCDMLKSDIGAKSMLSIIDIAIPRDVEPSAGNLDNISIYTIDDLKDIVDKNIAFRKLSINVIEKYINNKIGFYHNWYRKKINTYEKEIIHRQPRVKAGIAAGEYHRPKA